MKWFRKSTIGAAGMLIAGLSAVAAGALWQQAPLLFKVGNGWARWIENVPANSEIEGALYRLMQLPAGDVLFRRAPKEAVPALTSLQTSDKAAALYSLRALEEEQALDFDAAERDWTTWAAKANDPVAAHLDLADFYDRRLKPQQELAALEFVGAAPPDPRERWTAVESERSWQAWQRALKVVDTFSLPRSESERLYSSWLKRFPAEPAVYQKQFTFLLAGKDFAAAAQAIDRYRAAFPRDKIFPVTAEADLAVRRGQSKDGLAVYDQHFEPLWPADLVKSYIALVVQSHQERAFADALRARLAADPDDLKDAARLFYLYQQQGQLDPAKAVLSHFREAKESRGALWKAEELATLENLFESIQDFPEAARYAYAMAADQTQSSPHSNSQSGQQPSPQSNSNREGIVALTRILLTAPEQPLRVGAGNLALYKNIATMDRGPGYLNGILSLLLNTQGPSEEYASEDQLATPYFHRARAAELLAQIDQRFPNAPERPQLHASLMEAYGVYGENTAVIREGTAILANFPQYGARVHVALELVDAYERTRQVDQEFALYQSLLQELASQADGVPLGDASAQYSKPVVSQPVNEQGAPAATTESNRDEAKNEDANAAGNANLNTPAPPRTTSSVRSAQYAQVLDRYLARLVALHRLPDALTVLRAELDRNPQDPGLYEKLAGFLEQNALNSHEEEVYQRAIQQFQDTSWYAKLGRFYLRQKRTQDYSALMRKVAGAFSGTDLETFLRQAPAPDRSLALEVNLYAYQHFPHDLRFVQSLVAEYGRSSRTRPELEKLLWSHWSESPALRNRLFELLSSTGKLDAQLAVLRQQSSEIEKADWSGLAARNPAAERFYLESCLWQSNYEQAVGAADALAQAYPADTTLGEQASSLYRSLAYFHPENTDKAIVIEKHLLDEQPGNLELLARIGDTYADKSRFQDAAPYWLRMAAVRPGEADGYLQSATVFWDYFDFASAQAQLQKARTQLNQPTLFGYQEGAIEESQGDLSAAIQTYIASAIAETPSSESRDRLLVLAHRPTLRQQVEAGTSQLLRSGTPSTASIQLRASILEAEHRKPDLALELDQLVAQTTSFDVLDAIRNSAHIYALPEVEQTALRRQITLTADPVRSLQLHYELVTLLEQNKVGSATKEVEAIYREHQKILGVVRATVDYDWEHDRKPQAVAVLIESAQAAYPELKNRFQLEAARKLTDLHDFARAKTILEALLLQQPLDAGYESAMADNYARSNDQTGLVSFYSAQLDAVHKSALAHDQKLERTAELRRGMISAATVLNNWNDAIDQYIELINTYPDDANLTQEAALYAVAHNGRDRLFSFYEKTIAASPRDARWSIVVARLATAAEDDPLAIEAYGKALALRPERQDLYVAQASLEERLHRLDDAIALYRKLYTLSYRDPQWMDKVAELCARQGRREEAVKALVTAHIEGKPAKAVNSFNVAAKLESWSLLNDAQTFAEQGVDQAGADLLITDPIGVATYARILTRQRQVAKAYARLVTARQQASNLPLISIAAQVVKDGPGAVTSEEWRKQREEERRTQATHSFADALKAIGTAASEYDTPEETAQLEDFLKQNSATADPDELRAVFLPAAKAARLAQLTAGLTWKIAQTSTASQNGDLDEWLHFERQRLQAGAAAAQLEKLAPAGIAKQRKNLWRQAANAYQDAGDTVGELRVTAQLATTTRLEGDELARYYRLLYAQQPNTLMALAATEDSAAQYLVRYGTADQALSGISARGIKRTPVWQSAYTALTGLYLRDDRPEINTAYATALDTDATIGDRVAHPADRNRQLTGAVWFYYGLRYGEYLDLKKDTSAGDYLDSELEHTPVESSAYLRLANYSATMKRDDAAFADYQHSLALKHDQPAVLNSLAELEWNRGHKESAVDAWKEAVHLLATEMDARQVPETFWGDFTDVLKSITAHQQYDSVRQPVDSMLQTYIARNGDYRVEPLLKAAYRANGNSVDWLLTITAHAQSQKDLLSSLVASDNSEQHSWIERDQISLILHRIVELEEQDAATDAGNFRVDAARRQYVEALLREQKIPAASAELAKVPEKNRNSSDWLPSVLKIAESQGTLDQLLAGWKTEPPKQSPSQASTQSSTAPADSSLLQAASQLGTKASRTVRRFVYEQALNRQELTAPNFLGLAAIDLDEGNTPSAVDLLKRFTLVSDNFYADIDTAARLLEEHNKMSEALQFLKPLSDNTPWDSGYKVRLAKAMLAVDPQQASAIQMLATVASDSQARYRERLSAALALKTHKATVTGSDELKLLAQPGCPTAESASKPFFVKARIAAAACTASDKVKEQLLKQALAIAPANAAARLSYLWPAFALNFDSRALLAAEPYLEYSNYARYRNSQEDPQQDAEQDPAQNAAQDPEQTNDAANTDSTTSSDSTQDQESTTPPALKPAQFVKLAQLASAACERRRDYARASQLLTEALELATDKTLQTKLKQQQTKLKQQQTHLDLEQSRTQQNDARVPNVHPELEQDRLVRPRLEPGSTSPDSPSPGTPVSEEQP